VLRNRRENLYLVICAADAARDVRLLVEIAQQRGWRVWTTASPNALALFDGSELEALTGSPVRSAWRSPTERSPFPPADAIVVAPATFNTINKWAAGIADTLAVSVLCDHAGSGIPIAVLPNVHAAHARHPAYRESVDRLKSLGVRISRRLPHPFGAENAPFVWAEAMDLLDTEHG
jgi:phosphopantothenoylcysteine synthetase/decarboxylase